MTTTPHDERPSSERLASLVESAARFLNVEPYVVDEYLIDVLDALTALEGRRGV